MAYASMNFKDFKKIQRKNPLIVYDRVNWLYKHELCKAQKALEK